MSKEFNILISSVGRRVELVNLFKKAARDLNINSKIIGIDCSETAPALYFCDEMVISPFINSADFINFIIQTCKKFDIKLIVPTIDTELLLYSENKEIIEKSTNAKVLISNYDVVKICRNKLLTHTYLSDNNFDVPKLYSISEALKNDDIYPLFIKPIDGSSSINAFRVDSFDKMNFYINLIENPMIQSFASGTEYTVDAFLDFDSKIISICPRKRLATRGGEISKGTIEKNETIISEVKKLLTLLKPIGHITIQLILNSNSIKFIEINPRFGGGAPMSIQAGANSCEFLFKLLIGESLDYNLDFLDNVTFLRYDSSILIKND